MSLLSTPGAQASDARHGLIECLDHADPQQRLSCYDRLAERVRDAPVTSDSPDQTVPAGKTAATKADVEVAGSSDSVSSPAAEPDSVTSRIKKVSTTARGHRAFVLENGQTWIEVEVGRQPIEAGQTVTVNKRRWRHVMQLEGMPDIGVRRAD